MDRLLGEACARLGFCLRSEAEARLYADIPATVDAFTDAVITAEGLDPETYDGRRYLLELVAKYHCAPVPGEIGAEIGTVLDELYEIGFRMTGARYDARASGDFHVEMAYRGISLSQLRTLGLIKVLEKDEIVPALRKYAAAISSWGGARSA